MFTLRIVCEEVLDHYGSPIVREGEVVQLVVNEYGEHDHYTDYGNGCMHPDVLVFDTTTEEFVKIELTEMEIGMFKRYTEIWKKGTQSES